MAQKITKASFTRPIEYDEALVTSLVPYGESDCIARLFLKTQGRRVTFYRRGLRSSKSNPCPIQAPCFATVGYIDVSEDKLAKLVSCDIHPRYLLNVTSLRKLGFECYIAELIERFLPEHEPAPELFQSAQECFAKLAHQDAHASLLRAFELKLLNFCGYLPDLDAANYPIAGYDPNAFQFLGQATEGCLPFSEAALSLAKVLLREPIGQPPCHDLELLKQVGNIFLGRLRLLGGAPLQSIEFLKGLNKKTVPAPIDRS